MLLLPQEIQATLPAFYSTEEQNEAQKTIPVKFFTPWTNWTWYVIEFDPIEKTFFGYVIGFEEELGYFSLDEMESIKGPYGLKIERDIHWNPETTLDKVISGEVR